MTSKLHVETVGGNEQQLLQIYDDLIGASIRGLSGINKNLVAREVANDVIYFFENNQLLLTEERQNNFLSFVLLLPHDAAAKFWVDLNECNQPELITFLRENKDFGAFLESIFALDTSSSFRINEMHNNKEPKHMSFPIGLGVMVFIIRDGKYLFLKRKSKHGFGTWALPGGKIDYGEDPIQTAVRETKEETGLDVTDLKILTFTNDIFESGYQYMTVWLVCNCPEDQEPAIMEPEKHSEIGWYDFTEPPSPLLEPCFENFKSNQFDIIGASFIHEQAQHEQ
jgi:8-oxo-dGTP diphosphatase